jgi:heme O synthase-like polyprenyltransferase
LVSFAFLNSYGSSFDLFGIEGSRYFNPLSYISYAPMMLLLGFIFWIPAFFAFFGTTCLIEYIKSRNGKIPVSENIPQDERKVLLWEIAKFVIFTYIMITVYFLVMTYAYGIFDGLF